MASLVETTDGSAASADKKSRVAALLLSLIVLVVFALGNLPFQYVETSVEWTGYFEVNGAGNYRVLQGMPTMAGWPMQYWVRYTDNDVIQDRLWKPSLLIANILIGLALAAGIYFFLQWRHRRLVAAGSDRRMRMILDAGVAFILIGIPGTIFAYEYAETRDHRAIAKSLQRVGSAYLSCWLPEPIASHVPSGVKRQFVRIRKMHLLNPSPAVAGIVTGLPTLVSYHDFGGSYDSSTFDALIDNPHFCAIQLRRREISEKDMEAIARMPWLVQFFAESTNLDESKLRKLDHVPLEQVDLSFTDVALEEIGKPSWSDSVQILRLSRPADGVAGALTLEGWPELKELRVQRNSGRLNDAVLSLRLCDLPMLANLYINRMQKHDLVFKNVPRLATIDEGVAGLRYVVTSDQLFPGLTWVRKLEIDRADSLQEFACFARDLEYFSIKNARSLRSLAVGSFNTTLLGETSQQPADLERCRKWVEGFGRMDGPGHLDLTYLPLTGIDLKPLTNNKRIRRLSLGESGIDFQQVQQLDGMDQLQMLDIRTTSLAKDELGWVLNHFDRVRELSVDVRNLSHFDLRGKDRLRDVQVTPMGRLSNIHIVDLPQLNATIRLTHSPDSLEICNAQSLRGVAVEGPWPVDSQFHGLRDLEWFIAGGSRVNDAILTELLNCQSLQRLTLAYPSCSRDMLRQIGELKALTFLALPGADVDDDIVADWESLTTLWEVNLSDTEISVGTIAWLSRLSSLRRLSINRVNLSDEAEDALAELGQVSEIHLQGVDLELEKLRPLLRHGSIESIDLSGWQFTDELVQLLREEGHALRHLTAHRSEIDEATFDQLMEIGNEPYVDVGELPEFIDQADRNVLRERRVELIRDFRTGWRAMLQPQDDVYQTAASEVTAVDDRNNRVPVIPISLMSRMNRQVFVPAAAGN